MQNSTNHNRPWYDQELYEEALTTADANIALLEAQLARQ